MAPNDQAATLQSEHRCLKVHIENECNKAVCMYRCSISIWNRISINGDNNSSTCYWYEWSLWNEDQCRATCEVEHGLVCISRKSRRGNVCIKDDWQVRILYLLLPSLPQGWVKIRTFWKHLQVYNIDAKTHQGCLKVCASSDIINPCTKKWPITNPWPGIECTRGT